MDDIEELFNRQPPYSDDDLDRIIAKMRELRANYDTGGPKPKKAAGPKAKAVDLSDLGLAAPKAPTMRLKL